MAKTLYDLGYTSTKADPDVQIRPATKHNGFKYYEMLLVYVDDVLCISHDTEATMSGIQPTFKLKGDKVEVPTNYLGTQVTKKIVNGISCWTMSSEQYIKAVIAIVESKLDKEGQHLPSRCLTSMKVGYWPEIDTSAELKADGIQYFQELIGILRWACKLGHVDIALKFLCCLLTLHCPELDTYNRSITSLAI